MAALAAPLLVVFVGVLHHDDGSVDQHADRDRDAAEGHDVGAEALDPHDDEGQQDGDRDRDDRHQGRTEVEEKDDADQGDDDRLLDQGAGQGLDGLVDQPGAVVGDRDLDVVRQPRLELGQPLLDPRDGRQRVGARSHHNDAAYRLALAVPVGETAPDLRPDGDVGDIGERERRPPGADAERDLLEVADVLDIAEPAHHVLAFAHLDQPPADVRVGALDGGLDGAERHTVGAQPHRVDLDLVLAHEAAEGGDLRDPVDRHQTVLEVPVLIGAQLGERAVGRVEDVHEGPPDPGGVGAELRRHAVGQLARKAVEVLEHPRPRPVEIGAVLEDHVDEGETEEGVAADILGEGHRQHLRGDRIGQLVLDHLRRLTGIFGVDDDLDVGQIGNGVEPGGRDRPPPTDDGEDHPDDHDELVLEGPLDDFVQHGAPPQSAGGEGERSRGNRSSWQLLCLSQSSQFSTPLVPLGPSLRFRMFEMAAGTAAPQCATGV